MSGVSSDVRGLGGAKGVVLVMSEANSDVRGLGGGNGCGFSDVRGLGSDVRG